MSSEGPSFALDQCNARADIDFVTIGAPGKRSLPRLDGTVRWSPKAHYKQLTIHDPSVRDVATLAEIFPNTPILQCEVAVDFWPRIHDEAQGQIVLGNCFEFVARHLHPYDAPFMDKAKTLAFNPRVGGLIPFTYRTPAPDEQLLYGLRDDGPAQVKVYLKRRDQGETLRRDSHRVRVEVNLKADACVAHGLQGLDDFFTFQFRRRLSPYFRMVEVPFLRVKRTRRPLMQLVRRHQARHWEQQARAAWQRVGVQGSREYAGMHHRRFVDANQRTGKALSALQERFSRTKISLHDLIRASVRSDVSNGYGEATTLPITTKDYQRLFASLHPGIQP